MKAFMIEGKDVSYFTDVPEPQLTDGDSVKVQVESVGICGTDIKIFENERFGTVRTLEEDGRTLFCGSDVAKALGYKRPNDAINAHCRGTVKRRITDTIGREQETNFIPEGDIYRLAARSELPGAEEF